MISLATLLNKVQQRFTYRQRFLFFAAIFFLATPLPSYWFFSTQKALINQKKQQLKELEQSNLIGYILSSLAQFSKNPSDPQLNSAHQKEILSYLTQLYNVSNLATDTERPVISNSFSPSLPTQSILTGIQNFLYENISRSFFIQEKAFSNSPLEQLYLFSVSTGLLTDPTFPFDSLAKFTLYTLPEMILIGIYEEKIAEKLKQTVIEYPAVELAYPSSKDLVTNAQYAQQIFKQSSALVDQLQALENWRLANIQLIANILNDQLNFLTWTQNIFIILLISVTGAVIIFVCMRVLTRHLMYLLNHIQNLASGKFTSQSYASSDDEFSQVGLTFNGLATSLSDFANRIHSLGIVLASSAEHLTYEVMTHETNVLDQEMSISKTEKIASKIASDSKGYIQIINQLTNNSFNQLPIAQHTPQTLESLKNTIEKIRNDSQETLETLDEIKQVLIQAIQQNLLMNKVSEDMYLLAINASIEANSNEANSVQFYKITRAIEQFAERTALAAHHITQTLQETVSLIKEAYQIVEESLGELSIGQEGVQEVYYELQGIEEQTFLQMKTFERLDHTMKKQQFEAEDMIEAIGRVRKNAQTTTLIFQHLHEHVLHLGKAAGELKYLLEMFFQDLP